MLKPLTPKTRELYNFYTEYYFHAEKHTPLSFYTFSRSINKYLAEVLQ